MSNDRFVSAKNTSGRLNGEIAGVRQIAEELDCSYVWAATLLRRALEKVARQTMRKANGTEPTGRQVSNLASSDEFQNLIIRLLREKDSEARLS